MKQIETLLKKRSEIKQAQSETLSQLQETLQNEADKIFNECPELKQAVSEMDDSNEYGSDEYGEVSRWVRFEVPSQYESLVDELETWFQEYHCLRLDRQYDALLSYEGDCIIVNDEGDVFDSHTVVIQSDDCKDDEGEYSVSKRNELIEKYMESTGCYPAVLSQDRYGQLYPIDTKASE